MKTVKFPRREVTFVFSHDTLGDERVGNRFAVAFLEYQLAMASSPECDWSDFTASNGVRILAEAAQAEL